MQALTQPLGELSLDFDRTFMHGRRRSSCIVDATALGTTTDGSLDELQQLPAWRRHGAATRDAGRRKRAQPAAWQPEERDNQMCDALLEFQRLVSARGPASPHPAGVPGLLEAADLISRHADPSPSGPGRSHLHELRAEVDRLVARVHHHRAQQRLQQQRQQGDRRRGGRAGGGPLHHAPWAQQQRAGNQAPEQAVVEDEASSCQAGGSSTGGVDRAGKGGGAPALMTSSQAAELVQAINRAMYSSDDDSSSGDSSSGSSSAGDDVGGNAEGVSHGAAAGRGAAPGAYSGNCRDFFAPDNNLLHRVVASKTGSPAALALIYFEVAQRVGLSMEVHLLPGHTFLRPMVQGGCTWCVDPFNAGQVCSQQVVEARLNSIWGAGSIALLDAALEQQPTVVPPRAVASGPGSAAPASQPQQPGQKQPNPGSTQAQQAHQQRGALQPPPSPTQQQQQQQHRQALKQSLSPPQQPPQQAGVPADGVPGADEEACACGFGAAGGDAQPHLAADGSVVPAPDGTAGHDGPAAVVVAAGSTASPACGGGAQPATGTANTGDLGKVEGTSGVGGGDGGGAISLGPSSAPGALLLRLLCNLREAYWCPLPTSGYLRWGAASPAARELVWRALWTTRFMRAMTPSTAWLVRDEGYCLMQLGARKEGMELLSRYLQCAEGAEDWRRVQEFVVPE